MNTNTVSTTNSAKFTPMPMAALLANLMPLQSQRDSPDNSGGSDDDSDSSVGPTVAKKLISPVEVKKDFSTPLVKTTRPQDVKTFASEKKVPNNGHNKENDDVWSHQTYPNKDSVNTKTETNVPNCPCSEVKKRCVLTPHSTNVKMTPKTTHPNTRNTPEVMKPPSSHKMKTGTPKIKSGIRRFTPGSGRNSNKKTPLNSVIQNRDKVRCELFGQDQTDEILKPDPLPAVPDTPMNKNQMPASYVATPSYPLSEIRGKSKVLFKITNIKGKRYLFIKKLGVGGSSEVYKVLELGSSNEYAVKCVYLATDRELAQGYINEVRLLRELQNSDRVIKLHDYEYDRSNQFLRLVLEVGETDLSSFLKARGAGLPPALVLHYWEEMLHAVHYIHEHGVIHADLKPANFLLVSGRLKLIDFGIASAISSDATSVVRAQATGTYSYISPEALVGGAGGYGTTNGEAPIKISFRSDVWSLGCILYSMVFGRTPFGHIPNLAKLAAILDPNHRIDYPPVDHLPPSLISALKWCLTYNARARPTVRDLLSIPYLQPSTQRPPLPQTLLDKLKATLTAEEYTLLAKRLQ